MGGVSTHHTASHVRTFAVTKGDELYKLKPSDYTVTEVEDGASYFWVWKLNKITLQWNALHGVLDGECPKTRCTGGFPFFACGEKVIALMHHHDREGEITMHGGEVREVWLLCPSTWSAAIING